MVHFIVVIFSVASINLAAAHPCKLKMGWEPWEPYQYINKNNKVSGFDVELMTAVLAEMGCELELIHNPWKRLLKEIESGRIDIVAGTTITIERKLWGHFSLAYREETRVLFGLKESFERHRLNSLEDIINTNFQLGINRGSYNGEQFKILMNEPKFNRQVQFVNTEKQNVKKLLAKNRIDGFIGDLISGVILLRNEGMLDEVEIHPMEIFSSEIHFLFSKKTSNNEFIELFNESLVKLKVNGTYETIKQKYFY